MRCSGAAGPLALVCARAQVLGRKTPRRNATMRDFLQKESTANSQEGQKWEIWNRSGRGNWIWSQQGSLLGGCGGDEQELERDSGRFEEAEAASSQQGAWEWGEKRVIFGGGGRAWPGAARAEGRRRRSEDLPGGDVGLAGWISQESCYEGSLVRRARRAERERAA